MLRNKYLQHLYNLYLPPRPAFVDIDADGDYDMFVGGQDGWVRLYKNTGSATNEAWGETNLYYNTIDVGAFSAPAFANIARNLNSMRMETNSAVVMSYTNGLPCRGTLGLYQLEVGYPSNGVYRSGVFDTKMAAPIFRQLNWTHVEDFARGGDIDIRVRSADSVSGISSSSWTVARPSDDGYFQSNVGQG